MEYVLLAILLICAVVIIVAVTFQKSNEGLSGTIAGGTDNYYGKDKGKSTGKLLFRITLIACLVFAVAVTFVYVIQPDYTYSPNQWTVISKYKEIFTDVKY